MYKRQASFLKISSQIVNAQLDFDTKRKLRIQTNSNERSTMNGWIEQKKAGLGTTSRLVTCSRASLEVSVLDALHE